LAEAAALLVLLVLLLLQKSIVRCSRARPNDGP
jgi:hypothetical protein